MNEIKQKNGQSPADCSKIEPIRGRLPEVIPKEEKSKEEKSKEEKRKEDTPNGVVDLKNQPNAIN